MDGKKEEANPFSFKKFMTSESKKGKTIIDEDDDDIFRIPDKRQESSKKLLISADEDGTSKKPKKKEKSENPFSFKKFLSGSSKKSSSPSLQITDEASVLDGGAENPVFDNLDNSLPDFVQDHYLSEKRDTRSEITSLSQSSDSIEIPLDLPHLNGAADSCHLNKLTNTSDVSNNVRDQQRVSECFSSSDDEIDNNGNHNVGQILPDFLSGVSVSGRKSQQGRLEVVDDNKSNVYRDVDTEILKLRDENLQLKQQLEALENKRKSDVLKISELEKQVVEQRKKELEETSIMEKAMEQVEENLRVTTQRAVNAEGTITKLKQEIKTLQGEINLLRNETGQGKADHLSDVKERTSYVAQELTSATKTAENSLRQLLSGVDKLKLLSQVLESVDKITEHKQSDGAANDST